MAPRTFAYGAQSSQRADLYLPATPLTSGAGYPVVGLLHGGFWRLPYGRGETVPVALDLAARGYAVWNIEYRRVGEAGGGWPGTCDDIAAALDHLAALADDGLPLDPTRVAVAGHSAGGHLALWSGAAGSTPRRVRPRAVAGLAPVADLARTWELGAGGGAVEALLGGAPAAWPERYEQASPIERLPLGVAQLLIHGARDEALPVDLTRGYAAAARAAGDAVEFIELAEAGHMDFLDPSSVAHARLCDWLARVL